MDENFSAESGWQMANKAKCPRKNVSSPGSRTSSAQCVHRLTKTEDVSDRTRDMNSSDKERMRLAGQQAQIS